MEEAYPSPGLEALRELDLTAREAEVLYWIAQRKSNPESAIILGAARRTVAPHAEHILAKLGVENRTGAVVAAAARLQKRGP